MFRHTLTQVKHLNFGIVTSSNRMGSRRRGYVTEETLYPDIKQVLEEHGAKVVTTVRFFTTPDFIVEWLGEQWIISIKIGDPTKPHVLKKAFIQYIDHMQDTGIKYGMIIFYPEKTRKLEPSADIIRSFVRNEPVYAVVLNPQMELREQLSAVLSRVKQVFSERIHILFSPETVIKLLKAQVEDLMAKMEISEQQILRMVSSPELFFGINPVEGDEKKKNKFLKRASVFLASYIFLSQVLFLRMYCEERPVFLDKVNIKNISRKEASELFAKIKDINYRPIFDLNVLDLVPEDLLQSTFKLLFGIQVKGIRYELPGRLFHELMPKEVRKLLAAFYTRPVAASMLAWLTIEDPNATVFDPACGSGTILTMAYRRKADIWKERNLPENYHQLFCESHISGCDIMPFAVHLTNANLVAMNPLNTINLTRIALQDSLSLMPYKPIKPGFLTLMDFLSDGIKEQQNVKVNVFKRTGETTEITLGPVDVILMNPPFTKVERGISKYIDTGRFRDEVGGEVGLWGSFVALADRFLKNGGVFGAVLPINLLRGRESREVRRIIFQNWLPLYIIKASKNYGFSEFAEYRDVLVVAKKVSEKPKEHMVKFCMVKKDLNELSDQEVSWIVNQIKRVRTLRNTILDIDSRRLTEVLEQFENMMPFISCSSFDIKDKLQLIINESEKLFQSFPTSYFREGYGPRPKGSSKFMFITRPIGDGRIKEAFLILENETPDTIISRTVVGEQIFSLSRQNFLPALRTPVGLDRYDVTNLHDYVARKPYERMEEVMRLADFSGKISGDYWNEYIQNEYERATCVAAVIRRINPFSPNQKLLAFFSQRQIIVSDLFHAINEHDNNVVKALTVLFNSIFFIAQFFNFKEETTGRYTELRQNDLHNMKLFPTREQVSELVKVFEKYRNEVFPPLCVQFDTNFEARYKKYWAKERRGQETLIELAPTVIPHQLRLNFDIDVIKAVRANISKEDLLKAYEAITEEMVITKGLKKD